MNAPTPPIAPAKAVAPKFSYVPYDYKSAELQNAFNTKFEEIEAICNTHLIPSREQALVFTYLEIAYMWAGKAIRNAQVARTGETRASGGAQ